MRDLLLVAASGLARESLAVVRGSGDYRAIGYLDDEPSLWGERIGGVPVLGGLDRVVDHPGAMLVLCAGKGSTREGLAERLAALGVGGDRYASIHHRSVEIPADCLVGEGSILLANVVLTADVRVGRHVVAMPNVTLTHDDVIEDFATLAAGVSLGGGARIGTGAYIGMNASVRERCVVGAHSVLGMGAALVRDLPDGETWVGVPARRGTLAPHASAPVASGSRRGSD